MMAAPPRKRRLSAEQRRALAMLADAGRNGVNEAVMLANRFQPRMLAHLNREGLTTAMIGERVKASGTLLTNWSSEVNAARQGTRRALSTWCSPHRSSVCHDDLGLTAHYFNAS